MSKSTSVPVHSPARSTPPAQSESRSRSRSTRTAPTSRSPANNSIPMLFRFPTRSSVPTRLSDPPSPLPSDPHIALPRPARGLLDSRSMSAAPSSLPQPSRQNSQHLPWRLPNRHMPYLSHRPLPPLSARSEDLQTSFFH